MNKKLIFAVVLASMMLFFTSCGSGGSGGGGGGGNGKIDPALVGTWKTEYAYDECGEQWLYFNNRGTGKFYTTMCSYAVEHFSWNVDNGVLHCYYEDYLDEPESGNYSISGNYLTLWGREFKRTNEPFPR